MFEEFYGLREDPFRLSSDHRFCFPHRNYARARAYVDYALHRAEGFVMVTGNPGTGKTTLINELLSNLPKQSTRAATLLSTRLEAEDLLRMMAYALGLKSREQPKALLLQQLMEYMSDHYHRGIRTLLIIDEAQDLNTSALEELRLLTNLHEANRPLLQIVLVGQEPLRQLVRQPEMEQLHQRLIAAWHLKPLGPQETVGYVRHRLETAGWRGDPVFESGVMETVFAYSQGVPRRINLICSRLLLHGCISEQHRLTREDAVELVAELGEEELAPTVDATSAKSHAEVDWAVIDHGLDWAPPVPEPPSDPEPSSETATLADDGLVQPAPAAEIQSRTAATYARDGPLDTEVAPSTSARQVRWPSAVDAASASDVSLVQADRPGSDGSGSSFGYSAKAAPEPARPRPDQQSDQQAGSSVTRLPGLAVEDPGESGLSRGPSLRDWRPSERPASRNRVLRRRGPVVVSLIALVVLSLVPRDLLEWPMAVILPLLNSLAVSIGVSSPS